MTEDNNEPRARSDDHGAGRLPTVEQPFPLTPFEQYFCCDERSPDFPASIPMRWTVNRVPRRVEFANAFRTAIEWHPLLGCLVKRGAWQPDASAAGEVFFFQGGDEPGPTDRNVNVDHGPVIRCNVIESVKRPEGGAVIEIVVHHGVIDGVSLVEFIGDVFALYAGQLGKLDATKLRPPHHRYLAQRHLVDRQVPAPVGKLTVWKVVAAETIQFFTRRAEPLICERPPNTDAQQPAWQLVDAALDREATDRLSASATALNATFNDCAVASLLRVIANWNDTHSLRRGQSRGQGWLIANMPVLLRPRAAYRTSAANMIGYGLLARRRESLSNGPALVREIAVESRFIQEWKMAAMFLDGLSVASRIPGGLYLSTRWTQPATCVVTQIGDPVRRFRVKFPTDEHGLTVVGDLTLQGFSGAAPLRPGTHVAGMIHTLGGCLGLSLRVPPSLVSRETAQTLIDLWKQDLISY